MLLWQVVLLSTAVAVLGLSPVKRASTNLKESVFVGQIYSKEVSPKSTVSLQDGKNLPNFLLLVNNTLQGIPTKDNVGKHILTIKTGNAVRNLELTVKEESQNPCGDSATTWVEVIYSNDIDLEKRLVAAKDFSQVLQEDLSNIRVYDLKYSREIREVELIAADAEDGVLTIIKPICDGDVDAIEVATDDMDKLLDDDEETASEYVVTLTQGRVLSRNGNSDRSEEVIQTTTVRTTSQRTTRHAGDRAPVRVNSMNGFTCTRGVYCEALVPQSTFKDVEDGDTYKLDLKVKLLEGDKNWLYYNDKMIQGVPMKAGEYQFRLDARDSRGQMASAPFSVTVRDTPERNHLVTMALDLSNKKDFINDPSFLPLFVKQIATVTHGSPDSVVVQSFKKESTRTIVKWSNNTLPYKTCSEAGIEDMKELMFTKQRKQMRRDFEKAMTQRFNVRDINFELLGNCASSDVDSTKSPSVDSTEVSSFPWIILLAILAVVCILIAITTLLCTKKKVKKEKPSEFTGKGHPVVFPEEVGDEREMDNASTPMLTKEERPPLKLSGVSA